MFVKVLGLFDLFTGIVMIGSYYSFFSFGLQVVTLAYLGLKSIIFRGDFLSILDGISAVYIILMLAGFHHSSMWFIAGYLLLKGGTSFF